MRCTSEPRLSQAEECAPAGWTMLKLSSWGATREKDLVRRGALAVLAFRALGMSNQFAFLGCEGLSRLFQFCSFYLRPLSTFAGRREAFGRPWELFLEAR